MARTLRTLAALTAGALGAAAVARSTRRTPPGAVTDPPARPVSPPTAAPVTPPPVPRVVRPRPVPQRRPARIWAMHIVGWPCAFGMFLFLPTAWTLAAIWGEDAISHAEPFLWGSIGVMPVGGVLVWLATRDDEERAINNAWAHNLWLASHRRGGGGYDGTPSSGYSSSTYVADPTYGAAWSGGYDSGSSYDGGYSGGSDGGGGGGYSSSY